jgi:hypothetical protein
MAEHREDSREIRDTDEFAGIVEQILKVAEQAEKPS